MNGTTRITLIVAAVALVAGIANAASSSSPTAAHTAAQTPSGRHHAGARHARPVSLRVMRTLSLPDTRSRVAAAPYGGGIVISGGLSSTGNSTSTVYEISSGGAVSTDPPLPTPIHDSAAANLGGNVIVFGGGQVEGSNHIVRVRPGTPRQIGTLPQVLSDLDAATVGTTAYVAGGWNNTTLNPNIYAAHADGSVSVAGKLPLGVRYPAAAALGAKVIIAGGETAATTPTTSAWMFDPATRTVTKIPSLPVATDHAAGAALGGRFYIIGGLRNGVFTNAILSWAPGETRWHRAGHLPTALADLAAVPYAGGIAVIGGRGAAGQVADVSVLGVR